MTTFHIIAIIITSCICLFASLIALKAVYFATMLSILNILDLIDSFRGHGYSSYEEEKWSVSKRLTLPIIGIPLNWFVDFGEDIYRNFSMIKVSDYRSGRWCFNGKWINKK